MKNLITLTVILLAVISLNAQNIKIKKGDVLIDKKAVAKIDKQKDGFKISSLDGDIWFVANTINRTQNKNIAPKFWLELTGANGNLRESEFINNNAFTLGHIFFLGIRQKVFQV